jgi:hypothetical protein
MEQQKQKIKILDTKYNKENNVVAWYVEFLETNKKITLVWSGDDLGTALGIKQKIPPDMLEDFCGKMKDKTINMVINTNEQPHTGFKDMSTEQLKKLEDELTNEFAKCIPFLEEEK